MGQIFRRQKSYLTMGTFCQETPSQRSEAGDGKLETFPVSIVHGRLEDFSRTSSFVR